ncbi:MAG: PspC domain-containing protein [Woeseiaceae bacterium]|nr:PspC domain-containing protein [Woeseiaceae bacterium]
MSGTTETRWRHTGRRLYRDRENGWMFGVCAGVADYMSLPVLAVRIVATLCLLLFFVPTALAYIAAVLLLRERPLIYSGSQREQDFWRRQRHDDRWSMS